MLEAMIPAGAQGFEHAQTLHGQVVSPHESRRRVRPAEGLLPVCAWCKRRRKDDSTWVALGPHLTMGTATSFTHTICPECASLWTDQEHG